MQMSPMIDTTRTDAGSSRTSTSTEQQEASSARLLRRIKQVKEEVSAESGVANKDLILVLGNTGAGKSTFVNYMMNRRMVEVQDDRTGDTKIDCENPVAKIGHSLKTETLSPQIYHHSRIDLTLCDCPGFGDNRGEEVDIASMYAISQLARSARSVKAIVLVVEFASIRADRRKSFESCKELLAGFLSGMDMVDDIEAVARSLTVVFTKLPTNLSLARVTQQFLARPPSKEGDSAAGKGAELQAPGMAKSLATMHQVLELATKVIVWPLDRDQLPSLQAHLASSPTLPVPILLGALASESELALRDMLKEEMAQIIAETKDLWQCSITRPFFGISQRSFEALLRRMEIVSDLFVAFQLSLSTRSTSSGELLARWMEDLCKPIAGLSASAGGEVKRQLQSFLTTLRSMYPACTNARHLFHVLYNELQKKLLQITQHEERVAAEMERQRRAEEEARLERERRLRQEEAARRQREQEERELRELQARVEREREQEARRSQLFQQRRQQSHVIRVVTPWGITFVEVEEEIPFGHPGVIFGVGHPAAFGYGRRFF